MRHFAYTQASAQFQSHRAIPFLFQLAAQLLELLPLQPVFGHQVTAYQQAPTLEADLQVTQVDRFVVDHQAMPAQVALDLPVAVHIDKGQRQRNRHGQQHYRRDGQSALGA